MEFARRMGGSWDAGGGGTCWTTIDSRIKMRSRMPDSPPPPVSLRDVAKACGTHMSTVSRALRRTPGVGEKLRERIVAQSEAMGYRPNPQVAAHMREMKRSRKFPRLSTIALITFQPAQGSLLKRYVAGSRERAETLGYHYDELNFFDDAEGRARRLEQILTARGIQGIVLAPEPREPIDFDLRWEKFCGAVIGATHTRVRYGRIMHDPLASIREVIKRGIDLGYRSFALIDTLAQEERIRYLRRAGFLLEKDLARERRSGLKFATLPPETGRIREWALKQNRPLLIPNNEDEAKLLSLAGLMSPAQVGIAMAHRGRRMGQYAGILQQAELMGARAVDLVAEALTNYHPGFFEVPKELVVPGIWADGPSMRRQADSNPAASRPS